MNNFTTPTPYNPTAWGKLPSKPKDNQGIEAALIEFDINGKQEKIAWAFFINPKSISIQDKGNYTAIAPHAARVAHQQYSHAQGARFSIQDLRFAGWLWGKSVLTSLEGLRELLRCKPDKNEFSPKLLLFTWGSRRFGPCQLEEVSWDEDTWLGGDPSGCKLSLSLIEVPRPLTSGEKAEQERQKQALLAQTREQQGKPRIPLTARQKEDAAKAAKAYLEANKSQLRDDIQALISKGNYSLTTDAQTGKVTLQSPSGAALGTVLISDGKTQQVGQGITTIPLSSTGKLSSSIPSTTSTTTTKTNTTTSGTAAAAPPSKTAPPTVSLVSGSGATTTSSSKKEPYWVVLTGGVSVNDEQTIKTTFTMPSGSNNFRIGRIVTVATPTQDIDTHAISYPQTGYFSITYWSDEAVKNGIIKAEIIPV